MVFTFVGCLVKGNTGNTGTVNIKYPLASLKDLLMSKIVPKQRKNFCSAFPSLSLVDFLHSMNIS